MRALAVLALIFVVALGSPAFAAEAEKGEAKTADAKKSAHEPGTSVEMPFLIAPLSQDGKLVGYAYISSKINASSLAAAVGIREKTPFLQDAFIRDVNAAPVAKADDPLSVDQPALVARLLADAKRIAGSAKVVSFVIIQVQIAPNKPKQS